MEPGLFFWFKKAVAAYSDPLTIAMIFMGMVFIARQVIKKPSVRRVGRWVLILSFMALWVLSTPVGSFYLMKPIESRATLISEGAGTPEAIVVLGCGHSQNPKLPLSSRYKPCSMSRVVHAIHIHNETGLPIYFSGGPMPHRINAEAEVNADLAVSLNVDKGSVNLILGAVDTASEAKTIANELPDKTVYLVTSASHMFRAKGYLEGEGVFVVSSPTDHTIKVYDISLDVWQVYLPRSSALRRSAKALYEYLALFSQRQSWG